MAVPVQAYWAVVPGTDPRVQAYVQVVSGVPANPTLAEARATFLKQVQAIDGNIRLFLLPNPTDTTTSIDESPYNRVITYDSSIAGRLTTQGAGIVVAYNGTSNSGTTPDTANLSFGNGLIDQPFSVAVLANVANTAANRVFTTKTTEYQFDVHSGDQLFLSVQDLSAVAFSFRTSNSPITMDGLHLFSATYDGRGGATAADGMLLYQDGVLIASAATNDPTYVAMENTAGVQDMFVSAGADWFSRVGGFLIVWSGVLSAAQFLSLKAAINTYYGLTL